MRSRLRGTCRRSSSNVLRAESTSTDCARVVSPLRCTEWRHSKTGSNVRVAVTGAGSSGVFRQKDFEAALSANFSASALDGKSQSQSGLNTDIHADAEYRAHLIGVMARRAVDAANK